MLVYDEGPRSSWKLAVIEDLIRGGDGFVRRHTFAQVLDIPTDLSPNCILLKSPQVPLSQGLHHETVLNNNVPHSHRLDRDELQLLTPWGEFQNGRDASAPPRRMSDRLNLTFEPCYCLTQHVMRSYHKCMRTQVTWKVLYDRIAILKYICV